jgi:hypothetical protein
MDDLAGAREDHDGRDESSAQRSDRNWTDILQELRVTQTGTQIMSGFLLTLPFQQRFAALHPYELTLYVFLAILAAITTAVGLAPVALHRRLFRLHEKVEMVDVADRLLQTVVILVSLLTAGVVLFVLDFTLSIAAGIAGGAGILVLLFLLLVIIPRRARNAWQKQH